MGVGTSIPSAGGASDKLAKRLRIRLSIYFALATCLAGLTLSGNPDTEMLPVIACFFAIVGLVFVDLLGWFALPQIAAYGSLGLIALYSVTRFLDQGISVADDMQMVLVAELLVLVQAVLMMQAKNRRIYEQLAIFCLLELVVSAIFNDAISFGLLLLPLGVIGAAALALLQTQAVIEDAFTDSPPQSRRRSKTPPEVGLLGHDSAGSADSFRRSGLIMPRVTTAVLTPAVFLVSLLFFYGLPRTNPTAQAGSGGRVLVGFSESIRLGQIGRMLQSDAPALKIELRDRQSGEAYTSVGRLYLRGAVLEDYRPNPEMAGSWAAIPTSQSSWQRVLPTLSESDLAEGLADDIRVRITAESTNSPALFAVAPYHDLETGRGLAHHHGRWLIRRRQSFNVVRSDRMEYQFGSTAFRGGRQTRMLPYVPFRGEGLGEVPLAANGFGSASLSSFFGKRSLPDDFYVRRCADVDLAWTPAAKRLSDTLVEGQELDPLGVALAVEKFLVMSGNYEYTLDLSGRNTPGADPIEEFLTVHRRGTCQHFASAMALMLRSQGIPTRLVVGYSTNEFNSLGGFYVARQLHAHAWVEALIEAKWLRPEDLGGSRPTQLADAYWVRFDPTPGGGGVERPAGGAISEMLDLAHSIWADYVVQRGSRISSSEDLAGKESEASPYRRWIERFEALLSVASESAPVTSFKRAVQQFSWAGALWGVGFGCLLIGLWQIRWGGLEWRSMLVRRPRRSALALPREPFFLETVRLLERAGVHRSASQTPLELTAQGAIALRLRGCPNLEQPLRLLTEAFYHRRFGVADGLATTALAPQSADIDAALSDVREAIERLESQSRDPSDPTERI